MKIVSISNTLFDKLIKNYIPPKLISQNPRISLNPTTPDYHRQPPRYMMSISFAILPFLRGNSYYPGSEGFCTYYSDDVLDIDYHTTSDSDLLLYNILLSVVPFLITFIMVVVVIVVVVLCCRPKGKFLIILIHCFFIYLLSYYY